MLDTATALHEPTVNESKVPEFPELLLHGSMQKRAAPAQEMIDINTDRKKETNPILLVFKAMIVAKGILRKGLQETKDSNRRHERQWEVIVLQIQEQHKQTASSQKKWSYAYAVAPMLQVSGVIGGQWLKAKPIEWFEQAMVNNRNFADGFANPILNYTAQIVPNVLNPFLRDPQKDERIREITTSISQFGNQATQGRIDHLRVSNDAEQAPLQMKSQSSSSLYQNKGSEESSEKQQLQEVDRSLRDLMSQEAQVFQGSSGRG